MARSLAEALLAARITLATTSTRSLEFQAGWIGVLVAGVLLWPGETFETAVGYRALSNWAPESAWGVIFGLGGASSILGSIYDLVAVRRISALVMAGIFSMYATGVALANPLSVGWPFVTACAIGELWAFFQVRSIR